MLGRSELVAFVATACPEESRSFYTEVLGLTLIDDGPFAMEFNANGTMLRIAKVERFTPAQYTVLGWRVDDIGAMADALRASGVILERFEGMPQDDRGIWTSPDGAKVGWFNDPDGNTLSLTELA